MGDEEDAEPLLPIEPPQETDALGLVAQVHVGGRLVEHEEPRLLGEGAGEDHTLALPSRQSAQRLAGEGFHAGQPHGFARDARIRRALEESARRVSEAAHENELAHRVGKALCHVLRHHGDPPRHLGAAERPERLALHEDLAPGRGQDLGEEMDDRRLARGIRSDQPEDFPGRHREG